MVNDEFWSTSRKKFGKSLTGWYVIIIVPSFIILSLIFGATWIAMQLLVLLQDTGDTWSRDQTEQIIMLKRKLRAIITNSTLCNLLLKSGSFWHPRRLGGMYQNVMFVYSGSSNTNWKPGLFLIFSVKYSALSKFVLTWASNPSVPCKGKK